MKVIHMNLPWSRKKISYFSKMFYCGFMVNKHKAATNKYKSTSNPTEVTCKNCLASLAKMDREYPEEPDTSPEA